MSKKRKKSKNEQVATIKLRLHHPRAEGKTSAAAWDYLHAVNRDVCRCIQHAMADILLYLRKHTRFATKEESAAAKEAVVATQCKYELPHDCINTLQILRTLEAALKQSGVVTYVWSSTAHRLQTAEFDGPKLGQLVRGEIAYPTVHRPSFSVSRTAWSFRFEDRELKDGTVVQDPIITIKTLRPGEGEFELVCFGFRGRGAAAKLAILRELEVLGESGDGLAGWSRKTLTVRWVPKNKEWELLIAYAAPKQERKLDDANVVVIHRGIVNMLTVGVVANGVVNVYSYPGGDIVTRKVAAAARSARLRRDVSALANGRGRTRRYRALNAIGDSEARYMDTAIWKIARFVQDKVEESGASVVLSEDYGEIAKTDVADDQDRYLQLFVRKFPFFKLKVRIEDAVKRRAGVEFVEIPAGYISQKCPACDHTSESNIRQKPRVSGPTVERDGLFRCEACGLADYIDRIAVYNLLLRWEEAPRVAIKTLKKYLLRLAKILAQERVAARGKQNA